MAMLYHIRGPRVSAIRASPSSPVDRDLKKPLGQGRNPGWSLILRGSLGRPRDCRELPGLLRMRVSICQKACFRSPRNCDRSRQRAGPQMGANRPKFASLALTESGSAAPATGPVSISCCPSARLKRLSARGGPVRRQPLAVPACSPSDERRSDGKCQLIGVTA